MIKQRLCRQDYYHSYVNVQISTGIALGLCFIIISILTWVARLSSPGLVYFIFISLFSFCLNWIMLWQHKNDACNGFLSFRRGLGMVIPVAFLGVSIWFVYTYAFYKIIAPEILIEKTQLELIALLEENMPDDILEHRLYIAEHYHTALYKALSMLPKAILYSITFSILAVGSIYEPPPQFKDYGIE